MAELILAVGASLNIQILSNSSGRRIAARLLGYKPGESLIAEVQGVALVPNELRQDDELAVRCLIGRHIVGFKCTVVRVCNMPYPYFHLTYPLHVEQTEVRQDERVTVNVPVQVSTVAGQTMNAVIRDLSSTGAMLVVDQSPGGTGDIVTLSLTLTFAQVKRSLTLSAIIRSVQAVPAADPGSATFRIGTQFKDMIEDEKLFLMSFAYEQLSRARGATTRAVAEDEGKAAGNEGAQASGR